MQVKWACVCVAALLSAGWALEAEAQKKLPEDTAAVVNGKKVPMEAFDEEIAKLKKRFSMFGGDVSEAKINEFKVRILDRLVEDELIRQEISKARIKVDGALVEVELEEFRRRSPGGPDKFDDFLKRSGMDVDDIRRDITQRLSLKALLAKRSALKPTEAELKDYYNDNLERFESKTQVKASHILIKLSDEASEAEVQEARKKINRIYQLAKKPGADFAALAMEHSEGPSAPRGGDLGFFTKGRMVKEFEDAAFSTGAGQVAEPIKTRFGWHVLKVFELDPGGHQSFEEVKEDIARRLEASKFREARDSFLEEVTSRARIEKMELPGTVELEDQADDL